MQTGEANGKVHDRRTCIICEYVIERDHIAVQVDHIRTGDTGRAHVLCYEGDRKWNAGFTLSED